MNVSIRSNYGSTMFEAMKPILLILATLMAVSALKSGQVVDKNFLVKQKNIYELFWHVDQPTVYHPDLYQKARTFSIVDNVDNYNDKDAVNEFVQHLKRGMIPRGHVFTMMDAEIRHQTEILFRVMYSAKTFAVFYDTAVWARFNMNELMYVYALSVAVIQRPDTKFIKLPPMYEVLPHFFFNDDVLQKATNIAMGDTSIGKKSMSGVDYYILPTNYSGWYITRPDEPEQKLTYFTQDVGLNAFYFFLNHHFPVFMKATPSSQPKDRGAYYFFSHKQLLTRYYMERLSNDLGEISYVDVDKPIVTGYYPTMRFRNGLPFPHRETNAVVPLRKHKYVQAIRDFHGRISAAIDSGYVLDKQGNRVSLHSTEGLNVLGNLVQGNADSVNPQLYGHLDALARKVFGFGIETNVKYQVVPSALEMFTTSMRDPVFYSIYKNILEYYHKYTETVPMYKASQLNFPGVNIESVNVDKLITYFDNFGSMLNNGLSIRSHDEANHTVIKARQYRLNHKPFTYHIAVHSDKNTKAMVRIFLGPKFDEFGHEIDFKHNYLNFMQMDEFVVDLNAGSNTIDRSSHESIFAAPDEAPSDVFYNLVVSALEGTETLKYPTRPYGFPDRLLLPKGKKEGMTFKLFVVVSSLNQANVAVVESPIWGDMTFDGRAMGYPLDRPVNPVQFNTPNIFFKDVVIYHNELKDLNVPL